MATITWTYTPLMSKAKLPSGNTYYFKDADVRVWIGDGTTSGAEKRLTDVETAVAALSNATHWLGVTTTSLSDGATTNPITIGGESVTAVSGDIVQVYNTTMEFIFNGTAWQQLGASVGTLKAFAYVDEGEATFTPSGTAGTSSQSVSFTGATGATVLTSSVTATVPKTSSATKYLKVSSAGGSVSPSGTGTLVTGYPNTTGGNLVKSSFTPAKAVNFAMDGTDTEMLVITGGGSESSAINYATGAIANDGTGAAVLSTLGSPTTTGLSFTPPTISLSTDTATSTGAIEYIESVSESGTNSVTFDTTTAGKTATAITKSDTGSVSVPTWTPASQTITVTPKTSSST